MKTEVPATLTIIDSHTGGEPTRVVTGGLPDVGKMPLADMVEVFRENHDWLRSTCLLEPRGFDAMVGALLVPPHAEDCVAGVIFFNNVGYLNMCIHGTVGLAVTLKHMGVINDDLGCYRIDTPVGVVEIIFNADESISVRNVESYRYKKSVELEVPNYGKVEGDIAWGGNWFFIVNDSKIEIVEKNISELTDYSLAIRAELEAQSITGENGMEIDHIELTTKSDDAAFDGRNFVMCPGGEYDRSPCGTGTSAKLACLYADGDLTEGETWRQAGILKTVFNGQVVSETESGIIPLITGSAWVNGETKIIINQDDPFAFGISNK